MSENYNKLDRRVKTVEEAVQLLTQMALRADERIDDVDERMNGLEAALNNLTVKLEALADAQIRNEELVARAQMRTEESLARLAQAQERLAQAQAHLAETQAHTDQRLDALIDIVREDRENRKGQ